VSRFPVVPALLILALATLPTLLVGPREFTNWDDAMFVTQNVPVQHPTLSNLRHLVTHAVGGNVIPVTMATYVIDWQIHGSRAWGYVLTNTLLYAACCLLLIPVLTRSGATARTAIVAASRECQLDFRSQGSGLSCLPVGLPVGICVVSDQRSSARSLEQRLSAGDGSTVQANGDFCSARFAPL